MGHSTAAGAAAGNSSRGCFVLDGAMARRDGRMVSENGDSRETGNQENRGFGRGAEILKASVFLVIQAVKYTKKKTK